jgi:hypothetical protein
MTLKNVRFWVWAGNGPVKITLKPGQTLTSYNGGKTDEGWFRKWERFTYDEDKFAIECEVFTEERDCDGRVDDHSIHYCPINELHTREVDFDTNLWPSWLAGEARRRDYSAEAAGY